MKIKSLCLIFLLLFIFSKCNVPSVNLANGIERNIVLINIEEGNRSSIAQLLLKIDSMKPAVIALNIMFPAKREPIQDSLLMNAFKSIKNDFLIYWLNDDGEPDYPIKQFADQVTGMGFTNIEYRKDLVTNFTPAIEIDEHVYESFPLAIVKYWKPGFKHNIKTNRSIKINYTRSTEQFTIINGSDINNVDTSVIKDKIILLGYTGPKEEDKFFTPLRFLKEYPREEPDTYGIVIIANEIRTVLEYDIENK